MLSHVICQMFRDMQCLTSETDYPSREEVLEILEAHRSVNRTQRDIAAFHRISKEWEKPGTLSLWSSQFLSMLDSVFKREILSNPHPPFDQQLLEEGPGTNIGLYRAWSKKKESYSIEIHKAVLSEEHRLKERDIMAGRMPDMDVHDPTPSLQIGASETYLKGVQGRIAFYYGNPDRFAFPLPTESMILFLENAFCAVPNAFIEVSRIYMIFTPLLMAVYIVCPSSLSVNVRSHTGLIHSWCTRPM